MRMLLALRLLVLIAAPATAQRAPAGVWLFDTAPSCPGVTMMQVAVDGDAITGAVTTKWYGPMRMQNAGWHGNTLRFDLRNLNDRAHPTRRWTATFTRSGVVLEGDFWSSHLVQKGRRGSVRQAEARAFRFAPDLPPLGTIPPDALVATPPMGWSSWNRFAERIDDRTIRAMADAMVATGLRDAGYIYVNIDDGWRGERDAGGVLRPNAKFPDMKALADYVHSKGLRLGIYSSPGPRTCAGYEGSYGHVQQDARTFAQWGVDYLKYDLCSGGMVLR